MATSSRRNVLRTEGEGELEQLDLNPITPKQQDFVERLLSGQTISEAARSCGLSRRVVTYWLGDKTHPVRIEYEKQLLAAQDGLRSRVANLHQLAFLALEDLLSAQMPPWVRFATARLIYESHLQQLCEPRAPKQSADLIITDAQQSFLNGEQEARSMIYLYDTKNRKRVLDD
jgi:hypothetical protein